jgi:hypothetical protein
MALPSQPDGCGSHPSLLTHRRCSGIRRYPRSRGSPFKLPPDDPQFRDPVAQKRADAAGRLGQRRRNGFQDGDMPMLLPGLGQCDGASGRARLWPPWLTHSSRRRPVAAPPAEAAAAEAAGTHPADLVDDPPFGCGQGDQDRVRDDHSAQAVPPPTRAGPARRPATTSTDPAGDRAPAPGPERENPTSQAEPRQQDA